MPSPKRSLARALTTQPTTQTSDAVHARALPAAFAEKSEMTRDSSRKPHPARLASSKPLDPRPAPVATRDSVPDRALHRTCTPRCGRPDAQPHGGTVRLYRPTPSV